MKTNVKYLFSLKLKKRAYTVVPVLAKCRCSLSVGERCLRFVSQCKDYISIGCVAPYKTY